MTLIAYIFSAISGGVLFASGLLHAWQPFYFQQQIAAYEVVPAGFAPLFLNQANSFASAVGNFEKA